MYETPLRTFASDNNSGVHPHVLAAVTAVNSGHTVAYGDDPYTQQALRAIQAHFGEETQAFFVFGGTAANVLGLKQITRSYQAILCAETSHIHNDECGAPEMVSGSKLLTIPVSDGKITVEGIGKHMHSIGFEHHVQPKVISITQATEYGTIYTVDEIQRLALYAHEHQLLIHMDGARLANAAVSLGCSLGQISSEVGIDLLSFGGTKNGLMFGECILFLKKDLSHSFKYVRKQAMQLCAKMRFIGAQYNAYLTGDLWRRDALHANAMAQLLADEISKIPQIRITQAVQSNAIFAILPKDWILPIQQQFFFYVWNQENSEVRWMTSFDTTEEDISKFVQVIQAVETR